MFKDLRQNSPFYILYKGEKPRLETGSVSSVSQPMPKPMVNYNAMMPQQPEMVVDVKIKVGNNILTFEKLPAANTIADFSMNGNDLSQNVVISSNRDMIKTEIETMLSQSKSILESASYHQNVINECEDILKQVNPTFAKEKQQESTISNLEERTKNMENQLGSLLNRIEQLLSVKTAGEEKLNPTSSIPAVPN